MATADEKKRLEELLASFPTTEAEDEKLLTGDVLPRAAESDGHTAFCLIDAIHGCMMI